MTRFTPGRRWCRQAPKGAGPRLQRAVVSPSAMRMKSALRERLPATRVIRGRSADNRTALVCAQLQLVWRPSAGSPHQRRISVLDVYETNGGKYKPAGRRRCTSLSPHLSSTLYRLSSTFYRLINDHRSKRLALSLKISYNFFYAVSYSTKTYALKGIPQ